MFRYSSIWLELWFEISTPSSFMVSTVPGLSPWVSMQGLYTYARPLTYFLFGGILKLQSIHIEGGSLSGKTISKPQPDYNFVPGLFPAVCPSILVNYSRLAHIHRFLAFQHKL